MVPPINDIANPWNIGSNKMIIAPSATAPAVNKIGVVLTAPASIMACFNGIFSRNRILMKSMSNTEFLTITPANAIKPIIEVAVKYAPIIQWPNTIPTNDRGIAASIINGTVKF